MLPNALNQNANLRKTNMSFTIELLKKLSSSAFDEHRGNRDEFRYGKTSLLNRLYGVARCTAKSVGAGPFRWVNRISTTELDRWEDQLVELEWMYNRFEDDESRRLLVDVVAYRLMGHRAVRLATNNDQYWQKINEISHLFDASDFVDSGFKGWRLSKFDISKLGYPIQLYSRVPNVLNQFSLEQYRCKRLGVGVLQGQVAIDGGGCWGDTALNFSHHVGKSGQVFSFEFVDSNLKHYNRNLELNPKLAPNIQICANPLWQISGVPLFVVDKGPGSEVSKEKPHNGDAVLVNTISIDDLVLNENIERVHFIKMDIEGAEFQALRGAEDTIRRFKPQLAICVYHSPEDFSRLAKLIDSFEPSYRFTLGHFTIHAEETVLFARAQ